MKTNAYTLIEMFCVLAVFTVLTNTAALFYADGSRRCRNAVRQIEMHQTLPLVRQAWRRFVAAGPDVPALGEDGVLHAGDRVARTEGNRLILTMNHSSREYLFPPGFECQIEIETHDPGADVYVLLVRGEKRFQRRLVACRIPEGAMRP